MRRTAFLGIGPLLLAMTPAVSSAEVSVSVAIDQGHREFHLAVCEHYHVSQDALVVVRERKFPDEHIPVVFFLAREAKVSPDAVVALRASGRSWMDIALGFGLTAEVFHVEVMRAHGPPYGNAFGHYKGRGRAEWKVLRLPDADIVTLVNVKFLAAHHGVSPDDVVERWTKHGGLLKAHGEFQREKAEARKAKGDGGDQGKGSERATGKDKNPKDDGKALSERGAHGRGGQGTSFEGKDRGGGGAGKGGGKGRGKK